MQRSTLQVRGASNCRAAGWSAVRASNRLHKAVAAARVDTMGATKGTAPVVVFTTPGCPYCRKAKQLLGDQGASFIEIDVSSDAQLRSKLLEVTGKRTVPQIFVQGVYVGGSDDLAAKVESGEVAQLLQAPARQPLPGGLDAAVAAAEESTAAAPAAAAAATTSSSSSSLPSLDDLPTSTNRIPSCSSPQECTFSGAALVEYLQQQSAGASSSSSPPPPPSSSSPSAAAATSGRGAAAKLGQQLLEAGIITVVSDAPPGPRQLQFQDLPAVFYRKRSDAPRSVRMGQALNTTIWWGPTPARPAEEVAEDLRRQILGLYDSYLSPDGKAVRYKAMAKDPRFWQYVQATAELQKVDLAPLSREGLMAFAINLYNALVIHALVVHGTQLMATAAGRLKFFQQAARYNIGGSDYTCDDLENGILRGNRPAASALGMLLHLPWLSKGPFRPGDPRAAAVVQPIDPRIHFTLVCGAKSCPPIKLYSSGNMEEGLAGAAEAFCASDVQLLEEPSSRTVLLSKIFGWYYVDFGASKAERLRTLLPWLEAEKRGKLQGWLEADPGAKGIKLKYSQYNWEVNAAEE